MNWGLGGDGDGFLERLDLHHEVVLYLEADRQRLILQFRHAEAVKLRLQVIASRRQAGEPVCAVFFSERGAGDAALAVAERERDRRQDAALRVGDGTGDRGGGLSPRLGR
jgi:hypothetical protein